MLPEQLERIEQMLREYRICTGRCELLEVRARAIERDIESILAGRAADLASISSQNLDGMPHGTSVGNPTERAGIMLAMDYVPEEVIEKRRELIRIDAEIDRKSRTILTVEAWLNGLTAKQRWIVQHIYFEGLSYNQMNPLYRDEYGETCSKDSLRRIKKEAPARICEMSK